MGRISTRILVTDAFRKYPTIYRILRETKRAIFHAVIEFLRWVSRHPRVGPPVSTFRGIDLVRSGKAEGNVVRTSQPLPDLPSRSLIREANMGQHRESWPVFWVRLPNCRLVDHSLAPLDDSKRLMVEAAYGDEFYRTTAPFNYPFLPKATRIPGRWTSIVGMWSRGYYHWFTDVLPRLASLPEIPNDTGILVRGPLARYQRESLGLLGVQDRIRETMESHVVVEDFYFLSPVSMTGCTNPASISWLRQTFLSHASRKSFPDKLLIRRAGKTRGIENFEELANDLQGQGWSVVDLEEFSLADQIALFAGATHIVAEHGAALTNLLWCRPGCRVLELCPGNFLNGCYEGISLCCDLRYSFLVFPADSKNRFSVPINAVSRMQGFRGEN